MTDETYKKARAIKTSISRAERLLKMLDRNTVKVVSEFCSGLEDKEDLSKAHCKALEESLKKELAELTKEFEEL